MKMRFDTEKLYKLTIKQLQFNLLSRQIDKFEYGMKARFRKPLRVHMVYNDYHDGLHKAWFIAGGHLAETLIDSV